MGIGFLFRGRSVFFYVCRVRGGEFVSGYVFGVDSLRCFGKLYGFAFLDRLCVVMGFVRENVVRSAFGIGAFFRKSGEKVL